MEAGIYQLNRVKDESKVIVDCSDRDERELPQTFVDYEEHPREYMLSAVTGSWVCNSGLALSAVPSPSQLRG